MHLRVQQRAGAAATDRERNANGGRAIGALAGLSFPGFGVRAKLGAPFLAGFPLRPGILISFSQGGLPGAPGKAAGHAPLGRLLPPRPCRSGTPGASCAQLSPLRTLRKTGMLASPSPPGTKVDLLPWAQRAAPPLPPASFSDPLRSPSLPPSVPESLPKESGPGTLAKRKRPSSALSPPYLWRGGDTQAPAASPFPSPENPWRRVGRGWDNVRPGATAPTPGAWVPPRRVE